MKAHSILGLALVLALSPLNPTFAQGKPKPASNANIIARSIGLYKAGKFAEAQKPLEARIQQEKVSAERVKLQNALADVHYSWAEHLESQSDWKGAIAHYLLAYATDKTLRQRDAGADLNSIGVVYDTLNIREEALRYYSMALSLARVAKDRTGEARTLSNIGAMYGKASRYKEALRYYNLALPLWHEVKDSMGEAMTLHNMGVAYSGLNRYEEALRYYNLALPLRREARDQLGEAMTLNNMGAVYINGKRHEEALRSYNSALSLAREIKDRTGEANALNNIGAAYNSLSRYQEALRYYNLALPLLREVKDHGNEAMTLGNIGVVYDSLDRHEEALRYYNLALPLAREIKDRREESAMLHNIGAVYNSLGRYQEALRYYNLALPIRREVKDRVGEGMTLGNIGAVYNSLNRPEESLRYYNMALSLAREVKDRTGEANTLNNIGLVYDNLSRSEEALRYYNMALPLSREVKDRTGETITLSNMMWAHKSQGQNQLAILFGKQAVNVLQSVRNDNQGLDKKSQQVYLEGIKAPYETLSALLIESGRLPEAEQVSRMLKQSETFDFVRGVSEQAGTTETLSLSPTERDYIARYDTLGTQVATVGDRIAALEKIPEAARTAQQKADLEQLYSDSEAINGRFEVFRKELVAAFGAVTPDLEKVDVAASDEWQRALETVSEGTGKQTALLTTVVAPDALYVILTTSTTRLRFSTTIKSADLNTLINRFRIALTNPRLDPQRDAQRLWKIVFCNGDLEKALQAANVKVALWSLGGSLRYVPIDALHDGTTYLVGRERLNIVTTTTSKSYFKAPTDGQALGVGTSHAFEVNLKDEGGTVVETLPFSALTQVPTEVRGIIHDEADGGTGPLDGRILLEGDFNASQLQAQLRRGFRTVHIATHFRLMPGDAQKSFLLLGDGNPLPVFDWKVKMPLKNVELLTLSACETGLGADNSPKGATSSSPTGAEVGSLGEVAQLQGAAAVIVSLWSVNDSSTSQLMRDFYTKWRQNPTAGKGEALRQSQRDLLGITAPIPNDDQRGMLLIGVLPGLNVAPPFIPDPNHPFAHPSYWAPFTLIGNWR
ncbi:photosystem I assembly protein Ycf3 [Abditibacteriota bacterium]|nr:photosystem I assembly protein Ycf3 [Abditibacteriota bacterium]